MTALNISIYHLAFLSNQVVKSFEGLEKFSGLERKANSSNREMELILFENIITVILIRIKSLRDEYNRQFININDPNDHRISWFKYLCEPIWNRINRWKEIETFRSKVLAHNLRDREQGYKTIFLIKSFNDFDIPKTSDEIMLLVACVNLFNQLVHHFFENEYKIAQEYFQSHKNNVSRAADIDYEKEISEIIHQIEERRVAILKNNVYP